MLGRATQRAVPRASCRTSPGTCTALARAASTKKPVVKRGSQVNLKSLTKWAGLPGIPNITALDSNIEGLQTTFDQQSAFTTLVDGQITPADILPLITIRGNIVSALEGEQTVIGVAQGKLHGSLAERRKAEATIAKHKKKTDTQVTALKRRLVLQARHLEMIRHTRAGKVMGIAGGLAQKLSGVTGKEADNTALLNRISKNYKAQIQKAQAAVKAVPSGKKHAAERQRRQDRVTALTAARDRELGDARGQGTRLRTNAKNIRDDVAKQRAKYAKNGFDDAWSYQLRRWKMQDRLARLQAESKQLGSSDSKVLAQEKRITDASVALDEREASLPSTITQAILDTLGLQKEAGVPLGGFAGLPVGAEALSGALGFPVPAGEGAVTETAPVGITADQQAQLNQADALKAIVTRGTFLDTTSAGILGGTLNARAAGGVQWNNLDPGAVGQAVTPALAAKALAMGVDLNAPVGGGAGGSGGGDVHVVFNTAFPPSPQQAEEAARGVVAGLSYQGSVNSPRTSLGV
jgi:hypothetical protein